MRKEQRTERLNVDKATRLRLEEAGAKRGLTWGSMARELIFDGLEGGIRVEELAKGFEGVGVTLESIEAGSKKLEQTRKDVIDSLSKLSHLSKLELVEELTRTIQKDSGELTGDMKRVLAEVKASTQVTTKKKEQADMIIGGGIGAVIGAALVALVFWI